MAKDIDKLQKEASKTRRSGKQLAEKGLPDISELAEEDKAEIFKEMVVAPNRAYMDEREYLAKNDAQRKAEAMEPLYLKLGIVIDKLFDIAMNGKSEANQLKAILSIMDRTIGKPVEQQMETRRENRGQVIDADMDGQADKIRALLDAAKRQGGMNG